nr:PREDICTED: uncharacterized protein LOC109642787 [Paralichthys olivaceus]
MAPGTFNSANFQLPPCASLPPPLPPPLVLRCAGGLVWCSASSQRVGTTQRDGAVAKEWSCTTYRNCNVTVREREREREGEREREREGRGEERERESQSKVRYQLLKAGHTRGVGDTDRGWGGHREVEGGGEETPSSSLGDGGTDGCDSPQLSHGSSLCARRRCTIRALLSWKRHNPANDTSPPPAPCSLVTCEQVVMTCRAWIRAKCLSLATGPYRLTVAPRATNQGEEEEEEEAAMNWKLHK